MALEPSYLILRCDLLQRPHETILLRPLELATGSPTKTRTLPYVKSNIAPCCELKGTTWKWNDDHQHITTSLLLLYELEQGFVGYAPTRIVHCCGYLSDTANKALLDPLFICCVNSSTDRCIKAVNEEGTKNDSANDHLLVHCGTFFVAFYWSTTRSIKLQ